MNRHRLAEERSIEFHRAVADKIRVNPELLLEIARARVAAIISANPRTHSLTREWNEILSKPLPEILAFLIDGGEKARQLRQSTPFAGMLQPRERWRIWREVRIAFEAAS